MPFIEINSFFTIDNSPATHLGTGLYVGYPKIRIWEIDGTTYNLVIGSPIGSSQNTDGIMAKVIDGLQTDGFYSFVFTDILGYDDNKKYLIRVDGGDSVNEQYQSSIINPKLDADNIGNQVWSNMLTGFPPNSAGDILLNVNTNVNALVIDMNDIQAMVDLCIKYQTNRTRIDVVNKTLIVYDNDCTTILRTFKLLNTLGNPSTDEVAERVPIYACDNHPVC